MNQVDRTLEFLHDDLHAQTALDAWKMNKSNLYELTYEHGTSLVRRALMYVQSRDNIPKEDKARYAMTVIRNEARRKAEKESQGE